VAARARGGRREEGIGRYEMSLGGDKNVPDEIVVHRDYTIV
jgi:hypothetical protein